MSKKNKKRLTLQKIELKNDVTKTCAYVVLIKELMPQPDRSGKNIVTEHSEADSLEASHQMAKSDKQALYSLVVSMMQSQDRLNHVDILVKDLLNNPSAQNRIRDA